MTPRLEIFVVGALLLPAVWQMAVLGRVFIARAAYPMDIDWMEGGSLYHAYRLLHGLPLYGAPGDGFAPFPYPPLHPAVLAAAGKVFGLDYAVGRGLSAASFAATILVLAWSATPAGVGWHLRVAFGVLTAALAASAFPHLEAHYDLIRVDSLALLWPVILAAILVTPSLSAWKVATCAAMATAAVFTKQTNAFLVGWLLVLAIARFGRRGIALGAATLLLSGAVLAWIQSATHGWFWAWIFTNLRFQQVRWERLSEMRPLLLAAPLLPVAVATGAMLLWRRRASAGAVTWLGLGAACLPASLLPYAKVAGGVYDFVPVALLSGAVALRCLAELFERIGSESSRRRAYVGLVLAGSAVVALRSFRADAYVPSPKQWQAAASLNALVASLPGDVLIPNHPFVAAQNGRGREQFHDEGYQDALMAGMPDLDMPGYLRRSRASWVILSGSECAPTRGWVVQVFEAVRRLDGMAETLVGYRSKPMELLQRRRVRGKRGVHVVFDFEQGLEGFEVDGTAFTMRPVGPPGRRYVSSKHPSRGDAALGSAHSPPFTLDRSHLGFLIGGGANPRLSVELTVEGRRVKSAHGVMSDVLFEQRWDVRKFAGKTARLVLVDLDPSAFGHLLVARVHLFDSVEPGEGEALPDSLRGPIGPERPVRTR